MAGHDLPNENSLITSVTAGAALLLLIGLFLFGAWVTQRSADAALQHSAHAAAIFMDSAIEPLVQELAKQPSLSSAALDRIDKLLEHEAVRQKLSGVVIWRPDGTIAYAKDRRRIGETDPVIGGLAAALEGRVEIEQLPLTSAIVTDGNDSYNIYAPMHKLGSADVIAAAGYIEPRQHLDDLLQKNRRDTWAVVIVFALLVFGLVFNLIHLASKMITEQNRVLRERYAAQVRLNLQNEILQKELHDAHLEGITINEHFLQRIGADLHDGPAQFLALSLLKLDDIACEVDGTSRAPEHEFRSGEALEIVRCATQNALREIRSISAGLALPELEGRTPSEAIGAAVNAFVSTTQTEVTCALADDLPQHLPAGLIVCLYRFIQEGLNNAYRHAGGLGLSVRAALTNGQMIVEVTDEGPGFDTRDAAVKGLRLGLVGLRHRIEIVGGLLQVVSVKGEGTKLIWTVPLSTSGAS
ncbi:MAG: hypothetical protein K2Q28_10785 [Hyphomicrobium sp.]|nr:hypothetical protein [Hyphomicrobium sp.]